MDVGESLKSEVSVVEANALNLMVESDEDYVKAGDAVKQIKNVAKQVKAYWDPICSQAYGVYKDVNAKKSEMLKPLENAEKTLKNKISVYLDEKEKERRRIEEEAKKVAKEEAEKKRAEAEFAELTGDAEASAVATREAEMYEASGAMLKIDNAAASVDGVSHRKDWEIVSVCEDAVPVSMDGVVLRPVDMSAIKRLIKDRHGDVSIPGVVFKDKLVISVRT